MEYKDLSENQKILFEKLESVFIHYESITKNDFVTALKLLLKKYR